jgi:ubiquinone/menaquinone biosynthesis C-methylase UbiE
MSSDSIEEARIRRAYSRRQEKLPQDRYSYFNPGVLLIEQELERCSLRYLAKLGISLRDAVILEVGCGHGTRLANLIRWGASPEKMWGVDIIDSRIDDARRLVPSLVTFEVANACNLRFPDDTFDLALQFTAFSSVLDGSMRQRMAAEMIRILRPGGTILWYDFRFNNPWNKDVIGIGKREIKGLFCDCDIEIQRLTLFPQLARFLGKFSPLIAGGLSRTRVFSTHYLAMIRKKKAKENAQPTGGEALRDL